MLIRDIVEIDQQGFVADAVQLSMMADPDKNLPLCQGFVFNYDANKPKESTLGVLDAVRRSFHSANNPNIHLMIQEFGKGKSHLALVIANFFKNSANSPEVIGILERVKAATTSKTQAIYEDLVAYKTRSLPHLVICISGEVNGDLNTRLLDSLITVLEEHGITGTLAQHLLQKPLNYLRQLTGEKRIQANEYLTQINDSGDIDLDLLIDLLQEGHYELLPTVVAISEQIEGYAINFKYNLNIEEILGDIVNQLCTGESPRFAGLVILLDELNAYLRLWLKSPTALGGWALHNLTNVCSQFKGKIALLCLAQVRPSMDTQVPFLERKNYERFTTRIELAPSTYEPKSSLELLIDRLLRQLENSQWTEFFQRWDKALLSASRTVYERYITAYSNSRLPFDEFYRHLGLGCYPLHPLTAYLLCNLGFTQGRTIIQFIKEDVAQFIQQQPVEIHGELNFVRPVCLIDAFASNFAQHASYADYLKAHDAIAASAEPDELTVLKAIGLYYLSGDKITKPNQERHEELLSIITGFSLAKTRQILDKLTGTYQSVYYNTGNNTYRFYSGFSIADLRRKLEEDIEDKTPSLSSLLKHCHQNLSRYLDSPTVRAETFVNKYKLNGDDWQFERQIFTIDEFERKLSSDRTIRGLSERGLIAYFIGEYDQDLATVEKAAEDVLAKAPKSIQERVILAIPRRGTRNLARVLLMKTTLNTKSTAEKQEFGQALTELTKQFDQQLDAELQEMFDSCVYTCALIHKIPQVERKSLEKITSKMLEELYRYVPPVEGKDTLRLRSTSGSQIIGHISRQLLSNDLKEPFPNKSYNNLIDPVLVKRWRLLKPGHPSGNPYVVQVPQDPNIREAWDKISEMTDIGDRTQTSLEISKIWAVLSDAPFGHNELTFTILFTAWAAYHRAEIEFSGGFGIPRTRRDQVSVKTAPLHEWAQTNILEKPKEFVQDWVIQGGNKIIRHQPIEINIPDSVPYDQAQVLIEQIQAYQSSGVLDPTKIQALEKKCKQLQIGIDAIDQWFKPTTEAQKLLSQSASLESLVRLYAPLENTPPLVIREGVVTVRVSDQQRDCWTQTRNHLGNTLEKVVADLSTQAQLFETVDSGYTCKADIESKLKALEDVSVLPERFAEQLRTAAQVAEQRIKQLQDSAKIQERLLQAQQLFKTLVENSPQSQYRRVQEQIRAIADEMPAIQEESEYQQMLQAIDTRQDELILKISRWADRFSAAISRHDAYQLSQEINREINRFDDPTSRQQLEDLNSRIQDKILERQTEEAEDASLRSVIQQAQQKVQFVISLTSLIDTMQTYDELAQLSLPLARVDKLEPYQNELLSLQAQGRQAIEQKIEQLFQSCDRDLKKIEEYKQLKMYVQRGQKLIAEHPDFVILQERLKTAEQSLETKYVELQKRIADQKVIQEIQQHKLTAGNTILVCEQILQKIEALKSLLHYPEQHIDAIQRLINAFQGKRDSYSLRLDELADELKTVETLPQLQRLRNELAKLEFVFKDSTKYSRYEAFQHHLQLVGEDLERIAKLEDRDRQIASMLNCVDLLAAVEQEETQFHDCDRFRLRLNKLVEHCHQTQQQYIDQLTQWQQTLRSTTSTSTQVVQLQRQIIAKRSQYEGSDYEHTVNSLTIDVEHLGQLLALTDLQKSDTIEACQSEIDRLNDWKASQENCSELIEQRFQQCLQRLQDTQNTIQTRRINAANQWLTDLQNDVCNLDSLVVASQKLDAAAKLLKRIRQTRTQHEAWFQDAQKDTLRDAIQVCETIRNHDRESQILSLFQELPRDQRLALYQKLPAYLDSTTEVF